MLDALPGFALFGLTAAGVVSPRFGKPSGPPGKGQPDDQCYVTQYSQIADAVGNCTSLVLDGITVPANEYLNLNSLQDGSKVMFAGRTFFENTDTPPENLIEISGTAITIGMEPGAVIDGNGQSWWDGQGSNGGRPK